MYKGGYQIISLHDVELTSGTAKAITGVYQRVANNNRKVFLLSDVTVKATANAAATVLNDGIVNFVEGANGYTATLANGGTILIASNDNVTYTKAS